MKPIKTTKVEVLKLYLLDEMNKGNIDFSLRVTETRHEKSLFLTIHPTNKNGETLDFIIRNDEKKEVLE